MSTFRQRLPRLAALLLLAWLFATGVAFAHTCTSKVYIDCDDCCVEMKAIEAWTEPVTVDVQPAPVQVALPAPVLVSVLAWEPAAAVASWPASPPDPGGGDSIPIVFLRLAL